MLLSVYLLPFLAYVLAGPGDRRHHSIRLRSRATLGPRDDNTPFDGLIVESVALPATADHTTDILAAEDVNQNPAETETSVTDETSITSEPAMGLTTDPAMVPKTSTESDSTATPATTPTDLPGTDPTMTAPMDPTTDLTTATTTEPTSVTEEASTTLLNDPETAQGTETALGPTTDLATSSVTDKTAQQITMPTSTAATMPTTETNPSPMTQLTIAPGSEDSTATGLPADTDVITIVDVVTIMATATITKAQSELETDVTATTDDDSSTAQTTPTTAASPTVDTTPITEATPITEPASETATSATETTQEDTTTTPSTTSIQATNTATKPAGPCACGYKLVNRDNSYYPHRHINNFKDIEDGPLAMDSLKDLGWVVHHSDESKKTGTAVYKPENVRVKNGILEIVCPGGQNKGDIIGGGVYFDEIVAGGILSVYAQFDKEGGSTQKVYTLRKGDFDRDVQAMWLRGTSLQPPNPEFHWPPLNQEIVTDFRPSDTGTYTQTKLADDPTSNLHVYTIAWFKDRVQFEVDSIKMTKTPDAVSKNPAEFWIENLTTRDSDEGPPKNDVVLQVKSVELYYRKTADETMPVGCSEEDVCRIS